MRAGCHSRNSIIPVVSWESNLGSSKRLLLILPLGLLWHLEMLLSSASCFALVLEVPPFLARWTSTRGDCESFWGPQPFAPAHFGFCASSKNTAPTRVMTGLVRPVTFRLRSYHSKNCEQKSSTSWGGWAKQVEEPRSLGCCGFKSVAAKHTVLSV